MDHLSNSNIQYMKIRTKCSVLLFALVSAALGLVGCGGYYSTYPGYGPYYGGGYGGGPYYGGPSYGGYPGSVTVEVGDRPYYVHGAGYYPLLQLTLEGEDHATFGKWLRDIDVPVAVMLEGGYSNDLPELIDAFLTAWAD